MCNDTTLKPCFCLKWLSMSRQHCNTSTWLHICRLILVRFFFSEQICHWQFLNIGKILGFSDILVPDPLYSKSKYLLLLRLFFVSSVFEKLSYNDDTSLKINKSMNCVSCAVKSCANAMQLLNDKELFFFPYFIATTINKWQHCISNHKGHVSTCGLKVPGTSKLGSVGQVILGWAFARSGFL